mgnify:CR=1 FL=1
MVAYALPILAEPLPAPIQVSMYESECNALFREIHELSHEVSGCETERVGSSPVVGHGLLAIVAALSCCPG